MTRRLRLAAITVALFAMIAHALVPNGWMPGSGNGGAAIIPCDGVHHHGMDIGGSQKPGPKQDDSHRHDVCPFAAAAHVAPPANPPSLIPHTLALASVWQFIELPYATANARISPQSARAPPQRA